MSAVIIVLIVLCLIDCKIAASQTFWEDYSKPSRTNALKGIFVMVVFVSHFRNYVALGEHDTLAVSVVSFLGQLMVTPFLFFSGFGVMESIRKKGTTYVKGIPIQRALKTWVHFMMSVMLFWLLNFFLQIPMSGKDMLLSLVCLASVGNSTWYIFTMIFLYLITAVSFLTFHKKEFGGLICTTLLSLVYILVISRFQDNWWYNTALCYVFGMWYSALHPWVEKIAMRSDFFYCGALLTALYGFRQLMRFQMYSDWIYQLYAVFFMILIVGISMKLRLDNPFLQFLGKHTFSIYILQRLPMRFFEVKGLFADDHISVFIFCFLLTCMLAIGFDSFLAWFDKQFFVKRIKT